MTRIDMTAREWADLITPVIPHIRIDPDYPELAHIRIEAAPPHYVHAVASDRYTLAAEIHQLSDDIHLGRHIIHVTSADANASLKLFPYSKDWDPELTITIDTTPIPSDQPALFQVDRLALTITAPDGTRMVMRDRRNPDVDHLKTWRSMLAAAMARTAGHGRPVTQLSPWMFARWGKSVRRGEALTMLAGNEDSKLIVVLAGDHFAGLWSPTSYPAEPGQIVAKHRLWELLDVAHADPADGDDLGEDEVGGDE